MRSSDFVSAQLRRVRSSSCFHPRLQVLSILDRDPRIGVFNVRENVSRSRDFIATLVPSNSDTSSSDHVQLQRACSTTLLQISVIRAFSVLQIVNNSK
ncbi:hypothetical protein VNO78_00070 [Psophocarpus tetragonolobus]|uniref:Uncharacterized protein n=1 Tax=Psophocarpus tetragonolobus TaxID=3891 RepID=A0AAN9XTK3_PSOTE